MKQAAQKNKILFSKILESNVLLFCAVLILAIKIFSMGVLMYLPQSFFFADITKSELISLVNRGRESAGLDILSENVRLDEAARLKAQNMLQNQYFNHTSPSGVTPWHWFYEAGYNYKYAGENLAIGFYDSTEVYSAWLNSPSHKENILNPNYTEMGTAVLDGFGQNNTVIVVQLFGRPKEQSSPAAQPVSLNFNNPGGNLDQPGPIQTEEIPISTASYEPRNEFPQSSTPPQIVLGESRNSSGTGLYFRILNYVVYGSEGLLEEIAFGVSLILVGVLLIILILNPNIPIPRHVMIRSAFIILILSLSVILDKDVLRLIFSNQLQI
jgi:hypothetical protein